MKQAVLDFPKQFEYDPTIENEDALTRSANVVLAGMGGSHLAADVLVAACPHLNIMVQKDYGLIEFTGSDALYIASSYSGNTEEVIDFLHNACETKLSVAVIATGGTLIEYAKEHALPYIELPDTEIQPRSALGFAIRALVHMLGEESVQSELASLSNTLDPESLEERGKELADMLRDAVPIIYSTTRNEAVAYNWKIKCNETGKIPAFYNVFPELNHNEMTGFDVTDSTRGLSEKFAFIFLFDDEDSERNKVRMQVCKEQYEERGLTVLDVAFTGSTRFERIFSSLIIADWMAMHLADAYGTEAEQVPMIEDFKKRIA